MTATLGYDQIAEMLRRGAARLKENHEFLSKLDAATGDGDHGTTIRKIAEAVVDALARDHNRSIAELLEAVGWNVISVDGGSASPLLGSFFAGMADGAAAAEEIPAGALAAAFEAGVAKFRQQTPAKPGDKTMLDALVPAINAMRASATAGNGAAQMLRDAAEAARQGAEATQSMQARFGRARNLGPRSVGFVDPGATSIALLFAGMSEAIV